MNWSESIIVSRHPAAIEFLRRDPRFADAPVLASATADDVRGKIVGGNLPLHLAAEAAEVFAVEFTGEPPRGQEYTLADMLAAGAVLRRYRVEAVAEPEPEEEPVKGAVAVDGPAHPMSAPVILLRWLSPDGNLIAHLPYPKQPKPCQWVRLSVHATRDNDKRLPYLVGAIVECAGQVGALDENYGTRVSLSGIHAAAQDSDELPLRVNSVPWDELPPYGIFEYLPSPAAALVRCGCAAAGL